MPKTLSPFRRRAKTDKYEILLEIVKAANDRLDPENVTGTIMDNIQKLIPCEAWSILLMSEEKDELVFQGARGTGGENLRYMKLRVGEGIAGWVARNGEATIVNDVRKDSRFNSKFDETTNFRTRSILCAPLISRGQVIGVVELINKNSKRYHFSQRDLKNLVALLGPISVSLHNALLFQETKTLAITDDLTKLYNHRYVNQRLNEMIREHHKTGKSFSVVFLDLDGFKEVNDRFGHLIGGRTLIEIGRLIFSIVRTVDVVARYGGDEFIIIMPDTPAEDAYCMAEKIRLAVQDCDFRDSVQHEIHLSASFGISVCPDHADTLTELIQKADNAMYAVKYSGKNAVRLANGKES